MSKEISAAKAKWEEQKAQLAKKKPKNEAEAIAIERDRTEAAIGYLEEVVSRGKEAIEAEF